MQSEILRLVRRRHRCRRSRRWRNPPRLQLSNAAIYVIRDWIRGSAGGEPRTKLHSSPILTRARRILYRCIRFRATAVQRYLNDRQLARRNGRS